MRKFIIILLLGTLTSLFAITTKDGNIEAIRYLKSNQADKAYSLLQDMYKNKKYDNETLFLLGKVSILKKDFNNAKKYYEELLKKDENANRVKLELATIYYKIGDANKAKELLLQVKATQPPKKVGDNINEFLAVIDKNIPKNWSLNFSVGYLYDSNANQGPNIDTVLMYNLPFSLNNDAKQNSDHAKKYGINFLYSKKFTKFSLQTNLNFNMTDYDTLNNLDSSTGSFSIGPTWKDDKALYSVPFILSVQKIGHKQKYYTISKGISPQISYRLSPKIYVNTYLSYQNKKYYKDAKRESNAVTLSPSLKYFFNQASYGNFGAYIGREISKTKINSNTSMGLNIGYFKSFTKSVSVYLSGSVNSTKYEGIEAAYNKTRKDNSNSINGNLSYYIAPIKSNISLNLSYTNNHSNIEMYRYHRKQISISLSKNF